MEPNEETYLSKVAQSFIHTECSVVLIVSQGLRKLSKDQQPHVEGLRWQTLWWISQQYLSNFSLPWLSVIEQSPPSYICSYLKYELITDFLDKVPVEQHGNITAMHMKRRALEGCKFHYGKSSRLHSLQTAITSLRISQDHFGVPYSAGSPRVHWKLLYIWIWFIPDLWSILIHFLFLVQYNWIAML